MSESKFSVDQQRRMLVKGLGATTLASTLMPTSLFAAGRGPTAVIVGAGIAGLSAAWEFLEWLQKQTVVLQFFLGYFF